MANVDFRNVSLSSSVSFKDCDLSGSNFTGKDLSGMDLSFAVLEGVGGCLHLMSLIFLC